MHQCAHVYNMQTDAYACGHAQVANKTLHCRVEDLEAFVAEREIGWARDKADFLQRFPLTPPTPACPGALK